MTNKFRVLLSATLLSIVALAGLTTRTAESRATPAESSDPSSTTNIITPCRAHYFACVSNAGVCSGLGGVEEPWACDDPGAPYCCSKS